MAGGTGVGGGVRTGVGEGVGSGVGVGLKEGNGVAFGSFFLKPVKIMPDLDTFMSANKLDS